MLGAGNQYEYFKNNMFRFINLNLGIIQSKAVYLRIQAYNIFAYMTDNKQTVYF